MVRSEMLRVLPAPKPSLRLAQTRRTCIAPLPLPLGEPRNFCESLPPQKNSSALQREKKEGQCPSFFYIILLKKLIMQHADRSVGIVFINEH